MMIPARIMQAKKLKYDNFYKNKNMLFKDKPLMSSYPLNILMIFINNAIPV